MGAPDTVRNLKTMPHKMPDSIKEYLQTAMTPTHKIWWMRAIITDLEQKTVSQGGNSSQYFRIAVLDIDAEKDEKRAYAFDIHGSGYKDFRPKDRMSLFGHEPVGATHLSHPRFFYNHETAINGPCYQTHFIDRNFRPIIDMTATVEGSRRDKNVKFWEKVTGTIGLLPEEVTQRLIGGGFDVQPIYKAVSRAVNQHVKLNPDAKYPCANPRPENSHQGGKLVD